MPLGPESELSEPGQRPPLRDRRRKIVKVTSLSLGGVLGVFVALNIILFVVYLGKAYPNTKVAGKQLGSVAFTEIPEKLDGLKLLPESFDLKYADKTVKAPASKLGLAVNEDELEESVKQRHWLPVANLVGERDTPLELNVDTSVMEKELDAIAEANKTAPVDAKIVQGEDGFSLSPDKPGTELNINGSKAAVLAAAESGESEVKLKVDEVEPEISDKDVAGQLEKLQKAQQTKLDYKYGGKTYTATAGDIAGWYSETGGVYKLSDADVKAYLTALGRRLNIRVANLTAVTESTKRALERGEPLSIALEASPLLPAAKTLVYCTAARGVDAGELPALRSKLATTFADTRGWNLGGLVDFVPGGSGCNFTVWLSAASQMPTFGAICDPEWSCNVSPNVVINFDRWKGASAAWNAAGGSLDDYRSMVINHEVGHNLGFYHKNCGGAGQPAPVMQQQSIDLQGCVFNPWPLAGELNQLKAMLGL
jgi:hypothetical protein